MLLNFIEKIKSLFSKKIVKKEDYEDETQSLTFHGVEVPNGLFFMLEKNKVMIFSEDMFLKSSPWLDRENMALIRICDPRRQLEYNENWLDYETLYLNFFDQETDEHADPEAIKETTIYQDTVYAKEHLEDFLDKHIDKFIVVHCYAGISRSAAVALRICKRRLDFETYYKIKDSGYWTPNYWVCMALEAELSSLT